MTAGPGSCCYIRWCCLVLHLARRWTKPHLEGGLYRQLKVVHRSWQTRECLSNLQQARQQLYSNHGAHHSPSAPLHDGINTDKSVRGASHYIMLAAHVERSCNALALIQRVGTMQVHPAAVAEH